MRTKELIFAIIILIVGVVSTTMVLDLYLTGSLMPSYVIEQQPVITPGATIKTSSNSSDNNSQSMDLVSYDMNSQVLNNSAEAVFSGSRSSVYSESFSHVAKNNQNESTMVTSSSNAPIMYAFTFKGNSKSYGGEGTAYQGMTGSSYASTIAPAFALENIADEVLIDPSIETDMHRLPVGDGWIFLFVVALLYGLRRRYL